MYVLLVPLVFVHPVSQCIYYLLLVWSDRFDPCLSTEYFSSNSLHSITSIFARWFSLVAVVGHLSLFPLFFTSQELPSKVLLHLSYLLVMSESVTASLCIWEKLYLSLSIPLVIFCELIKLGSLPFLPLLMYSLYCAIGIIYTYTRVYINFLCY